MKKIKYILPIILLFITINVKAIEKCTTEEMNRLNNLAKNVEFKVEYQVIEPSEENDYPYVEYKFKLINMSEDLRIAYLEDDDDDEVVFLTNSEFEELRFYGGNTQFEIYSYSLNLCTNRLLRTENIKLSEYNIFYYKNKDKCNKYPEFKYCKEFLENNKKSEEEMEKEFDQYIKSNSSIIDNIKNINYYYFIIGGVFIFLIIIVFIIIKNKRKTKDL